MKIFLLSLAAAMAVTSPSLAIPRYNSKHMTCQHAQATIKRDGAVDMFHRTRTGSGVEFDRYVAGTGYCQLNRALHVTYLPTADTNKCVVLACKVRP